MENNVVTKQINIQFKILYAIGIIFVVAGHCGNGGVSLMYDWFPPYAFHLGLFTFASGYFYKRDSEKNLGKYIVKKIKHLLVPIYLWNLFYGVVTTILRRIGFNFGVKMSLKSLLLLPITEGGHFILNLGGWFVIPLFMVQIFNCFARKIITTIKIKLNEYMWFVLNLLLGMLSVSMIKQGYTTEWWLVVVRFLFFLPFYQLGILYKSKLEKRDKLPGWLYFSLILIVQYIIVLYYKKIPTYVIMWGKNFNEISFMPFLEGFLGIAFWLRISKMLEPLLKDNRIIMTIADNSFSIMINHLSGFLLFNTIIAIISKYTKYFSAFNFSSYKNNIYYFYKIGGINHSLILYLIVGIAFPIIIQKALTVLKNKFRTIKKQYANSKTMKKSID